ncbi:unnamed protein product [Citrullus colocynthis]|uniref:Uncharacterized protein n=1 Tax=Citrullus colocynthis TaxID=252529 RepID=A0ABP0XUW0_9ROSI
MSYFFEFEKSRREIRNFVLSTYSLDLWRVDKEDGNVDEFDEKLDAIDGNNKDAIRMNKGHSIEHLHGTIEDCGQVRIRLEIFTTLRLTIWFLPIIPVTVVAASVLTIV